MSTKDDTTPDTPRKSHLPHAARQETADNPPAPRASQTTPHAPEPTALATAIEHTIGSLTHALEAANPDTARDDIDRLRSVASELRSLGLRFDQARSDQLARREEEVHSITLLVHQTIRDLARSNSRLAGQVGSQAEQLDSLADLDPDDDLVTDRLRDIVTTLHQATTEVGRDLTHMTSGVETSNQRIAALERELEEARQKARIDALTKVHSRAALDERLAQLLDAGRPFAFLLADIDRFKRVNDTLGHLVGDALLFKVARVLDTCAKACPGDAFVARYGGEEFVILLDCDSLPDARRTAESMRRSVADARYQMRARANAVINPTISIGLAQRRPDDTVAALIGRADAALYQAKHNGRNQVRAEDGPPSRPEPPGGHHDRVASAAPSSPVGQPSTRPDPVA